jgi:hypothetical protein
MALNSNAIVTLAEAKAQMKLVDTNTNEDATFEGYINEISSAVELYCKRKFVSQSITSELHDGSGGRFLYPRYFPIQQLSTASAPTTEQKLASLQYRDTPDSTWMDIEDNINNIFIETGDDSCRPYIELYDTYFPVGRRNITVSYKAGYTTVPSDVKMAVLEMIQMRWNEAKRGNDWLGQGNINASQSGNSFSTSLITLDKRWKMVLDRYRVPSMG